MRKLLAALLLCLSVVPAFSQAFQAMTTLGFQNITNLTASTALTIPAGTAEALVICTGATVMWRTDGTAPTSTVGMPLPVNTPFPYVGGDVPRLRLIQASASAACTITYFGF